MATDYERKGRRPLHCALPTRARFVAATDGVEVAEEMQRYRIERMATREAKEAAGGVAPIVQPWAMGCGVVSGP